MQEHLQKIVYCSLGSSPEDMLKTSLNACIEMSGASGGSILGEEGPSLQFLFSNVVELIGMNVPFDSLAGETARKSLVIYTYAPSDKRHFEDVDEKIHKQTKYLLSIPIPSTLMNSNDGSAKGKNAGTLQLLFENNIFPDIDVEKGPREFPVDEFRENDLYNTNLKDIFFILPIIAFGMEIVKLRQTSYQAIHELKNKMIAGLSWVNYLREDITAGAPELMYAENIMEDFDLAESSIREGAELAKTYLQFTKIFSPKFTDASVNDVLRETASSIKAFAMELNAVDFKITTDLAPDNNLQQIDPGQLKMAFFNLCKNAVEVLVEHSVTTPAISIRSRTENGSTTITIEDNGPGMPQEIAENLFIPFKTKKEGGTGLGLTITKKIIDIHNGSIKCSTGVSGTRFDITI